MFELDDGDASMRDLFHVSTESIDTNELMSTIRSNKRIRTLATWCSPLVESSPLIMISISLEGKDLSNERGKKRNQYSPVA